MTPSEIELAAREQYNAIGDTNWSQLEIFRLIYAACLQLAREALAIERTYTTSTVASQQEYSYPTNTISISRITYEGTKLAPISFQEDDVLTLNNASSSVTGTPQYYAIWNETIYLRPIPSGVGTLKIFSYNEPQAITSATATMEVPSQFHMGIVDFVLARMFGKDQNEKFASYHMTLWNEELKSAKRWAQKKKRGDNYAVVKDEDSLSKTVMGLI
jgi:selenocysteine-specific translation elongation factor